MHSSSRWVTFMNVSPLRETLERRAVPRVFLNLPAESNHRSHSLSLMVHNAPRAAICQIACIHPRGILPEALSPSASSLGGANSASKAGLCGSCESK